MSRAAAAGIPLKVLDRGFSSAEPPEAELAAETDASADLETDEPETDLLPDRARSEWDDWWDRFFAAQPSQQFEMFQALIDAGHPPHVYDEMEHIYAFFEVEQALLPDRAGEVLAFLERMEETRPEVFRLEAACYLRTMVPMYLNAGQADRIAPLLRHLFEDPLKSADTAHVVLDYLLLAGLHDEARNLVLAMHRHIDGSDLLPHAVDEIENAIITGLIWDYANDPAKGNLSALQETAGQYGWEGSEENLSLLVARCAGCASVAWSLADFEDSNPEAGRNLFCLGLDFGRWLTVKRGLTPTTAQALLFAVVQYFAETMKPKDRNPLVLIPQRVDRYLCSYVRAFTSSAHPALVACVALMHFYAFLPEIGLIAEQQGDRARETLRDLWEQTLPFFGEEVWREQVIVRLFPQEEAPLPRGEGSAGARQPR